MNEETIKTIVEMSAQGKKNEDIAEELGVKYSTLCYWRMRLRDRGVAIKSNMGRPKKI
jgi:transposase